MPGRPKSAKGASPDGTIQAMRSFTGSARAIGLAPHTAMLSATAVRTTFEKRIDASLRARLFKARRSLRDKAQIGVFLRIEVGWHETKIMRIVDVALQGVEIGLPFGIVIEIALGEDPARPQCRRRLGVV